MKRRITNTTVNNIREEDKEIILWDDLLPGFGVRVRPNGRRYYTLKYRLHGRQRWMRLGRHGIINADEARQLARDRLDQIVRGKAPGPDAPQDIEDLWARFDQDHVPKLKPWTREAYRSAWKLYIKPQLGRKQLLDLTHQDIARLVTQLRDQKATANRIHNTLSSMFGFAIDNEWLEQNPCRRVKKYRQHAKERYLSPKEMSNLIRVLDRHHNDYPYAVQVIKLLLFTGARKSEIVDLEWSWVDLDSRVLRLPDSKTGAKQILLNDAAIDVLHALPHTGDRVINGPKGGRVRIQRYWKRIRQEAGLEDVRLHDLRHNFASAAVNNGLSLPVIGALLGHRSVKTTARYAHLYDDVLREATNKIGATIAKNGR